MTSAPDHEQARLRLRYDFLARTRPELVKPHTVKAVSDRIVSAMERELKPSSSFAETWGTHIHYLQRAMYRCCVRDRVPPEARPRQREQDIRKLRAWCAKTFPGNVERRNKIEAFFGVGPDEGGPPSQGDIDNLADREEARSSSKSSAVKVTVKVPRSGSSTKPGSKSQKRARDSDSDADSDDDYLPDSPTSKRQKASSSGSSLARTSSSTLRNSKAAAICGTGTVPSASRQTPSDSTIVISDDDGDDSVPPTDLQRSAHTSPKQEPSTPTRRAEIKNEPLSPVRAATPQRVPGPSSAPSEHASPGSNLERAIASSKRAWEAALAAAHTVQTWVSHARTTQPPSVARAIVDELAMAQRIRVVGLTEEQRVRYALDGALPAHGKSDWDRAEDAAARIAEWIEAQPRACQPVEVAERFVVEMKLAERIREVEKREGWSEERRVRYVLTGEEA